MAEMDGRKKNISHQSLNVNMSSFNNILIWGHLQLLNVNKSQEKHDNFIKTN